MKKLVLILVLLPALALAGENEGLTYEKKDGVIVIDYSSSRSQKRLEKQAEESGEKSQKQWSAYEYQKKSQHHAPRRRYSPSSDTNASADARARDSKKRRIEGYKNMLEELDREERSKFMGKYEREYNNDKRARIKAKIKEIQRE